MGAQNASSDSVGTDTHAWCAFETAIYQDVKLPLPSKDRTIVYTCNQAISPRHTALTLSATVPHTMHLQTRNNSALQQTMLPGTQLRAAAPRIGMLCLETRHCSRRRCAPVQTLCHTHMPVGREVSTAPAANALQPPRHLLLATSHFEQMRHIEMLHLLCSRRNTLLIRLAAKAHAETLGCSQRVAAHNARHGVHQQLRVI